MRKATQQQTKDHNKRLILKTIYNDEAISRASIARTTHLTRTTVSSIVAELIDDGLVAEAGHGPSRGGKPPILLSFLNDSYEIIGLDLGNSHFRGALLDLKGNILHSKQLPVGDHVGDDAVDLACQLIYDLMAAKTRPLLGIGIGVPGITDAQLGIVDEAVNLGWKELPVKERLESHFNIPIHIANDSQLAALGEFNFGLEQNRKNFIVVKAGQGISAGIVLNGRLYAGDSPGHGEIGHVKVVERGEPCACGNAGCLETIAGSRALIERAQTIFKTNPNSLLHNFVNSEDEINTDIILQAFEAGDEMLIQMITDAGKHVGMAIAYLIGILNIHHIVISGRLTRFGESLLIPMQEMVRCRALTKFVEKTSITLTSLGADIVIKGAAALILSNELGVV